ncbi:ComEC/Rec2 family competence protein [Gluconobacter kondonii]|uniref:hypothetical protein n=1 Tax=Gluconobacter kondonii TaxID=941463 RepID=UPI001B8B001F|nr:hypothetical protein [Gluconobacter kondonii]MBS1080829.1 hypothetical protein [Gluconobacter kondonii]
MTSDRKFFKLRLDWWPVGQGLFASGIIKFNQGNAISWVYDCGTVSSQTLLSNAIKNYEGICQGFDVSCINLAVLSHFDWDHISGLTKLIATFRVKILLLPYLPLWQRLILAIEQGVTTNDPFFEFFVDPVGYLRGLDGEIEEILLVPPSSPDDAPDDPIEPIVLEEPDDTVERLIKVDYAEPPDEAGDDPVIGSHGSASTRFLARGGRLQFLGFWEFVPYNDAEMAGRADAVFVADARRLAQKLKDEKTDLDDCLEELKRLYEFKFKNSIQRNLISLFLYSGPIGNNAHLSWHRANNYINTNRMYNKFSQMHTGDGTLKGEYWTRFRNFYHKGRRLEKVGIFQVMHHGAIGNSEDGMADRLKPIVSIFSSNPATHQRHPDAAVLRDFWPYHPVQVDDEMGFHYFGHIIRQ